MIPLLKFSEIKKNPNVMILNDGHAAIVRYGDVVGFVVEPERMRELSDAETKLNVSEALRDSQFEKLWALTQAIEVARNDADEDFDLFLNHLSNILKGKSQ